MTRTEFHAAGPMRGEDERRGTSKLVIVLASEGGHAAGFGAPHGRPGRCRTCNSAGSGTVGWAVKPNPAMAAQRRPTRSG